MMQDTFREDIKNILEAGIHAPSGENCQPWRFEVRGDEIRIFNLPERDQSLYNYGQMASYAAHGALIENILIASSAFGYKARFNLFPEKEDEKLVAIISLEKTSTKDDPLFMHIQKRCTNRKPYKSEPLSGSQLAQLTAVAEEIQGGRLLLIQDREKINILACAGSVNEQVMLSNEFLHNFFFTHINWTQEEEEQKRIGFYIKTLELPPPAQIMFKIFRRWSVMRVLNRIGLAKAAAKGNARTYVSCAAMGVVVVPRKTPQDFITAGMMMQRVWLKATQLGLSIQPLTGVLFFMQGIRAGHTEKFTSQQLNLIKDAYADIKKAFGLKDQEVAMMFRIGEGGEPSARSSRLAPQVVIDETKVGIIHI